MLDWFRAIMPKEDRFFDLFENTPRPWRPVLNSCARPWTAVHSCLSTCRA